PSGTPSAPLNPLALAVALDAPFVAQAFSGEIEHTANLIAQAIQHRGFALVNVLHPCPTWNRVQTFSWYEERLVRLDESGHDPRERDLAFAVATQRGEEIPIGVLYMADRPTFADGDPVLSGEPLGLRPLPTPEKMRPVLAQFV
ncbi:MAG TPA: 2-oxoacid ferredoxin oxidoreductase, partial [Candidatus Acetothermia bacterium]|nr:2-oxoacid ferredoxin oxidoreductase [Candidatus Acetothermia bacterium]